MSNQNAQILAALSNIATLLADTPAAAPAAATATPAAATATPAPKPSTVNISKSGKAMQLKAPHPKTGALLTVNMPLVMVEQFAALMKDAVKLAKSQKK